MAQIRIEQRRGGLGWVWLILILIIIAIIAWFIFVPRQPRAIPARPAGTAPSSLKAQPSSGGGSIPLVAV